MVARFTQEDTYRGDGLNLYAYCQNNPVCHVDPSGHCSKDPNGDFMPPAVVPEGKQLPAVYVPQQEALRRWYANFQDDAGTAGRAGSVGSGDFMSPAVIPRQPLPSMDSLQPSLMPEPPPKQLPAVIYPLPQDLLGGNPQNRVSGPAADVPNSGNRVSGSVNKVLEEGCTMGRWKIARIVVRISGALIVITLLIYLYAVIRQAEEVFL